MKKRDLFFAYLKKYRKVYLDTLFYAAMLATFVAVWLDKIFIGLQYNKILVFFVSLFILYAPSSLIFMKKMQNETPLSSWRRFKEQNSKVE